ncbi:murein hydrolase activator EnvC family protein [Nitratiruptor tergarcus]|uniref:Septal ring factor EnvC, activator of murein hydrolases AmiA and AmiB n=1 Tax=Nitratiruptor tergarcus DSM 16512 TaxID=1069081 RepID=A0A1W1WTA5_9BACT|nr:peptidoglycan DD-metalloendopeptidase family protein [Nitratiruptor tergarcus]SMC09531.1 Septal ring factor EnvC, activator of murein hydrolases AmiA and AmiB [Nitratiruptor tergarcus DSM 16512]
MRIVVTFIITIVFSLGATIDTKIKSSRQALHKTTSQIKGLNVRLAKLAKSITRLQKDLSSIDKKLLQIETLLKDAQKQYSQKLTEYNLTKNDIEKLTLKEKTLKQQLVLLITQSFSKSLLLTSLQNPTEEDVIKEEILKAIQKSADMHLKQVSQAYQDTKSKLTQNQTKLAKLEKEIAELLRNKEELKRLKSEKSKKLAKLDEQKRRYNEEIKKLIEQRKSLQKTLRKLSILKESAKKSTAFAKVKVKKYGEKSYKKIRTVRYRGPKTIPPLEKFIIIKRYGVYRDPIYNIDIPNENVELKPIMPNAKVRNVLNGRVILAKWTPHLKNVVIVKHKNGLYTIYAYLDKLAPYVKKGRKLKRGYTIGRVNNKLIFEVTKNNAHINPLELIRIN